MPMIFLHLLVSYLAFAGAPEHRDFWVWDLSVMPPGFRHAHATLKSEGARSLIYVEDGNTDIHDDFVSNLKIRLEQEAYPNLGKPGIIPLEEALFAPLPKIINPDERVTVLFADLKKFKDFLFDGFFNAFDQLKEDYSWKNLEQHSNESNIIYINGFRQSVDYTIGVIAHELEHLLNHHAGPADFSQDLWLSETMGESAMLVTGYYSDQGHVNQFSEKPQNYPLVSQTYVQYGPQILFAAFLMDTYGLEGLTQLTRTGLKGRLAIEALEKGASFDEIYSRFVNYLFQNQNRIVPKGNSGIHVPSFRPMLSISTLPFSQEIAMVPYSFALIELDPSIATGKPVVEKVTNANPCSQESKVYSKALDATHYVVFVGGCEQKTKKDIVPLRISIQN